MLNSAIQQEIKDAVLCWLATSDQDGQANVSPKEIFCCLDNKTIVIANIASPGTVKNLKYNAKVCFSFVNIFTQRGQQIKGTASLIRKRSYCPDAFKALEEIAGAKFPIHSLLWMEVLTVKPILAPTYTMYPETTQKQMVKQAMERYGVVSKEDL